ncbi:MAG TPA: hypothetical protein VGK75_10380 [Casimicrobiaceae bacterium]
MDCGFLLDVTKALIGTAAGAILGVGTAFLTWRIQQRRIDLAAGNIAVVTLAHCLSTLRMIGRAIKEEQVKIEQYVPGAPPWMTVRAPHAAFKRDLALDLKQLAFLSDRPELLQDLALAERLYHDLAESIDEYRKVHLQIQQAMGTVFQADAKATRAQIEKVAGVHLIAQANTLLAAILDHVNRDEQVYRRVATELSAELEKRLGRSLLLRRKQKITKFKEPSELDGAATASGATQSRAGREPGADG